jgi:hypothetical protein
VPLQWIRLESLSAPLAHQIMFGRLGLEKFANPGNANVLMALPLLAGWDLVACLVQLPFAAIGAWAAFVLARTAGASAASSVLAALAFASAPLIVNQSTVPLTDLASGALSLAAVAILLGTASETAPPRPSIALAGLALGLALGTKYTVWSHLPLVALALVCCRWIRHGPAAPRARALLLFAGMTVLPAAFWYVRNAVLFDGNPVYPLRIQVLGFTLMPGTAAEVMSGYWEQRMGWRPAGIGWPSRSATPPTSRRAASGPFSFRWRSWGWWAVWPRPPRSPRTARSPPGDGCCS